MIDIKHGFFNNDCCAKNNQMKKIKHAAKLRKPNKSLQNAALQFIADSSPFRFSRNLRNLLLDYISQNKDCLPVDFDSYLNDFTNLFAFLDKIDDQRLK